MTPYPVEKLDKKYQVGLKHPETGEDLVMVTDFFFEEHRGDPVIGGVPFQVGPERLVGVEFATDNGRARVRGRWGNGSWYWTGWEWNDDGRGLKNVRHGTRKAGK